MLLEICCFSGMAPPPHTFISPNPLLCEWFILWLSRFDEQNTAIGRRTLADQTNNNNNKNLASQPTNNNCPC